MCFCVLGLTALPSSTWWSGPRCMHPLATFLVLSPQSLTSTVPMQHTLPKQTKKNHFKLVSQSWYQLGISGDRSHHVYQNQSFSSSSIACPQLYFFGWRPRKEQQLPWASAGAMRAGNPLMRRLSTFVPLTTSQNKNRPNKRKIWLSISPDLSIELTLIYPNLHSFLLTKCIVSSHS